MSQTTSPQAEDKLSASNGLPMPVQAAVRLPKRKANSRAQAQRLFRGRVLGGLLFLLVFTPFLAVSLAWPAATGWCGQSLASTLGYWMGLAGWIVPVITLAVAMALFESDPARELNLRWAMPVMLLDLLLVAARLDQQGGVIGRSLDMVLVHSIGGAGSWMVAIVGFVSFLCLLWQVAVEELLSWLMAFGRFSEQCLYGGWRATLRTGAFLGKALALLAGLFVAGVVMGWKKLRLSMDNQTQARKLRKEALERQNKLYAQQSSDSLAYGEEGNAAEAELSPARQANDMLASFMAERGSARRSHRDSDDFDTLFAGPSSDAAGLASAKAQISEPTSKYSGFAATAAARAAAQDKVQSLQESRRSSEEFVSGWKHQNRDGRAMRQAWGLEQQQPAEHNDAVATVGKPVSAQFTDSARASSKLALGSRRLEELDKPGRAPRQAKSDSLVSVPTRASRRQVAEPDTMLPFELSVGDSRKEAFRGPASVRAAEAAVGICDVYGHRSYERSSNDRWRAGHWIGSGTKRAEASPKSRPVGGPDNTGKAGAGRETSFPPVRKSGEPSSNDSQQASHRSSAQRRAEDVEQALQVNDLSRQTNPGRATWHKSWSDPVSAEQVTIAEQVPGQPANAAHNGAAGDLTEVSSVVPRAAARVDAVAAVAPVAALRREIPAANQQRAQNAESRPTADPRPSLADSGLGGQANAGAPRADQVAVAELSTLGTSGGAEKVQPGQEARVPGTLRKASALLAENVRPEPMRPEVGEQPGDSNKQPRAMASLGPAKASNDKQLSSSVKAAAASALARVSQVLSRHVKRGQTVTPAPAGNSEPVAPIPSWKMYSASNNHNSLESSGVFDCVGHSYDEISACVTPSDSLFARTGEHASLVAEDEATMGSAGVDELSMAGCAVKPLAAVQVLSGSSSAANQGTARAQSVRGQLTPASSVQANGCGGVAESSDDDLADVAASSQASSPISAQAQARLRSLGIYVKERKPSSVTTGGQVPQMNTSIQPSSSPVSRRTGGRLNRGSLEVSLDSSEMIPAGAAASQVEVVSRKPGQSAQDALRSLGITRRKPSMQVPSQSQTATEARSSSLTPANNRSAATAGQTSSGQDSSGSRTAASGGNATFESKPDIAPLSRFSNASTRTVIPAVASSVPAIELPPVRVASLASTSVLPRPVSAVAAPANLKSNVDFEVTPAGSWPGVCQPKSELDSSGGQVTSGQPATVASGVIGRGQAWRMQKPQEPPAVNIAAQAPAPARQSSSVPILPRALESTQSSPAASSLVTLSEPISVTIGRELTPMTAAKVTAAASSPARDLSSPPVSGYSSATMLAVRGLRLKSDITTKRPMLVSQAGAQMRAKLCFDSSSGEHKAAKPVMEVSGTVKPNVDTAAEAALPPCETQGAAELDEAGLEEASFETTESAEEEQSRNTLPRCSDSSEREGYSSLVIDSVEDEVSLFDSDEQALAGRSQLRGLGGLTSDSLARLRRGDSLESTEAPAEGQFRYELPPISLLDSGPLVRRRMPAADKSEALISALASFGVKGSVRNVVQGPAVTRYEIEPGRGVKVSKFTALTNDIALVLEAKSIRIEAPVPGKSVIGIEVPNDSTELVVLKDIIDSDVFRSGKGLCIGLGKDISGRPRTADLEQMPHLLVAGTTGSGKSVCINTLILSLLYRYSPSQLQMVMVDPKQVELSIYEGLPHLVGLSGEEGGRIIVQPDKAAAALKQMVDLMESRYTMLAKCRVRNLAEYNAKAVEPLPWVVVIIDELADLMMVASKSVENSICRIAQKARAAGIHLLVATQRPSTDVITGLMKVNIPSRIAFAVSSGVDSRVILDTGGAEHLLGKGDMLFKPVDASEAHRIQGAWVSNSEIQRVVEFWHGQAAPENRIILDVNEVQAEESTEGNSGVEDNGDEELIEASLPIILRCQGASASLLQTELRIGYSRARRIINALEERGYVGPAEGSKSRKVFYTGFE